MTGRDKAAQVQNHSPEYWRIRQAAEHWPDWKKETYNCNFAVGAHAEKLKLEGKNDTD